MTYHHQVNRLTLKERANLTKIETKLQYVIVSLQQPYNFIFMLFRLNFSNIMQLILLWRM